MELLESKQPQPQNAEVQPTLGVAKHSFWMDLKEVFRHFGKLGWAILILLLLSSAAFAGWQTGFFANLYKEYNRAEILVVVKDTAERPLPAVPVSVLGTDQLIQTDENGRAYFDRLQAEERTFSISLPGFKDFYKTVTLKRGLNPELVFSLEVATGTIEGTVYDWLYSPIAGAKVSAAGAVGQTDSEGKFVLKDVIVGTVELKFEKEGYYPLTDSFVLQEDDSYPFDETLVAKGRLVFASNRDGNNAIWWSRLDGTDEKKLIENVPGRDDNYPSLSPDKKKIVFSSTRSTSPDSSGYLPSELYYVEILGGAPKKIFVDEPIVLNSIFHGWLADSSGFIYETVVDQGGRFKLWLVRVPDLTATLLLDRDVANLGTEAYLSSVVISFSDWIAFSVYSYLPSDDNGIYLIRSDGTGQQKISSAEDRDLVAFSPDGTELISRSAGQYYSYNLATSSETAISGGIRFTGVYSSVQNLWAYTDYRDGKSNVYVAKSDGTGERRITNYGYAEQVYFAGPGDLYLAYYDSKDSALNVAGLKGDSSPYYVAEANYSFAGFVPE